MKGGRMKGAGMRFVLSAPSVEISYELCFVFSDPMEVSTRIIVRCLAQYNCTMKTKVSRFVLPTCFVQMLYELCFVYIVAMKVTESMKATKWCSETISTAWMNVTAVMNTASLLQFLKGASTLQGAEDHDATAILHESLKQRAEGQT